MTIWMAISEEPPVNRVPKLLPNLVVRECIHSLFSSNIAFNQSMHSHSQHLLYLHSHQMLWIYVLETALLCQRESPQPRTNEGAYIYSISQLSNAHRVPKWAKGVTINRGSWYSVLGRQFNARFFNLRTDFSPLFFIW